MTAPGPVSFRNPREMRTISAPNGWDRLNALDVLDLVTSGPKRGRLARMRERLIVNLTDLSPANTHRLRGVIAKRIQCGRWGNISNDPEILPLGPLMMDAAGAITLVRLGIHPVAYAVLTTATTLVVAVGDIEIGDITARQGPNQEMHLDFHSPDDRITWTPGTRTISIREAAIPDTVMRAMPGKPLNALVRHALADIIDAPIDHVAQSENLEIICEVRTDRIRLRDIDPVTLARAGMGEF